MSGQRIIPRSEWGARHRDGWGLRAVRGLDKWEHHTVTGSAGPNATLEQDIARVRQVEDIGASRFGGMSYTFLFTEAGRIFAGHSLDRIGAHTAGRNTNSVAFCLIGNYDGAPPTAAQEAAMAWLLNYGQAQGWWNVNALTGGHRDVKATSCPGAKAYARIPAVNALARGVVITSPSAPVITPPAPAPQPQGRPVLVYGTVSAEVGLVQTFLKEVAGTDHQFTLDEFQETMRSRLVSAFSDALASSKVAALDLAARYTELGEALLPILNPDLTAKYGLELATFVVENVSVPPEVEAAIDKRSSMAAVGNLNEFVKYQMAKGMEQPGGGGAAGTASELAVGFAIAQQLMQQGGVVPPATAPAGAMGTLGAATATAAGAGPAIAALPDLLSPEDAAKALGVSTEDVMAIITSGELAAKKIGASYRIKRAALQEYINTMFTDGGDIWQAIFDKNLGPAGVEGEQPDVDPVM